MVKLEQMADAILDVATLCKRTPPLKLRSQLQNASASKTLSAPQLRQWTNEIYPQYAQGCGIAEAIAPLVRSGRANQNVINSALSKIHPEWTIEVIRRVQEGELTVNYGGTRRKGRKQRKQKRKARKSQTRRRR